MKISIKNKKAVSLMIGYVLLVTLAIVMSIVAYSFLKTYVPGGATECPDGVSLFVKEAGFNGTYNSTHSQLVMILKNNGRFNLLGYYIFATNNSNQPIATIDLSSYWAEGGYRVGTGQGSYISFGQGIGNSFTTNEEAVHVFYVPLGVGELYSLSVTPTRIEEEDNRERFVSCSGARAEQLVGEQSVPFEEPVCGNGAIETGEKCDDNNLDNNDGCSATCQIEIPPECNNNNIAEGNEFCDGTDLNGESCQTLGYDLGTLSCNIQCGFDTNQCSDCPAGQVPDGSGGCTLVGNGICDAGETCSNPDCNGQQAQCNVGFICQDGGCVSDGTYDIADYCRDLGVGYTSGTCAANNGGCVNQGGELASGGNIYCTPSLGCCIPSSAG
ncbi:MAG: DUF4215 domain-containing protein [Candidatus Pacearchaeota archaeon]